MEALGDLSVRIVRSPRRKKTISASIVGKELLVHLPLGLSREEEWRWVKKMKGRAADYEKRRALKASDATLKKRAAELNQKYFGGTLRINSIGYSTDQGKRFGSCTTETGNIRISHRLTEMPDWVRDYVLIHEMAHLVVPGHSKEFWDLVCRYKYAERARGYLMAKDIED